MFDIYLIVTCPVVCITKGLTYTCMAAISCACFTGFQPNLGHRCNMEYFVCSWGQELYMKFKGLFVSPELSSVRDYVITHSVRSMCMYVVFCKIDHCIHIHWCIVMGLGHNDPWVESHMWPQQTWGQRSSRGQWPLVQVFGKKGQCIHILWSVFSNLILQWLQKYVIAKSGETRGSRTALLCFTYKLPYLDASNLFMLY